MFYKTDSICFSRQNWTLPACSDRMKGSIPLRHHPGGPEQRFSRRPKTVGPVINLLDSKKSGICSIKSSKAPFRGRVIEQIKELLVKGELKRGDRLPPERQLADMLGVSRPSLREALRALEYAGMLETRVGEGIFVADGDSIMMNNLLMLHLIKQYALEEMIEVRKVLETSNVRFAVLRARRRGSRRAQGKFSTVTRPDR